MNRLLKIAATATLLAALASSCTKDTGKLVPVVAAEKITYTNTIKALMETKCVTCHGHGYAIDLSTYNLLLATVTSGELKKRVLEKGDMPIGDKLNNHELNSVQQWLELGAPE